MLKIVGPSTSWKNETNVVMLRRECLFFSLVVVSYSLSNGFSCLLFEIDSRLSGFFIFQCVM